MKIYFAGNPYWGVNELGSEGNLDILREDGLLYLISKRLYSFFQRKYFLIGLDIIEKNEKDLPCLPIYRQ